MKIIQPPKIMLFIMLLLFLFITPFVNSIEPTQQYNKIFLNPYHITSMNGNQWYDFSVTVNPPDKISEIKSAIINFELYMTPTVTFDIKVNNQSCNTPSFSISTTYANSGYGTFSFDCSNIITKSGTYTISLRASRNEGSGVGWLDLTYMNSPRGFLDVQGTEYVAGDNGTIFISLNSDNVELSVCDIDVYYPNKTFFIQDTMTYLNSSQSLFYKDFIVPNVLGVYMVESECWIPLINGTGKGYYSIESTNTVISNNSIVGSYYFDFGNIDNGDGYVCYPDRFEELQSEFFGEDIPRYVETIYDNELYLYSSGTRTINSLVNFYKRNFATGIITYLGNSSGTFSVTSTPTKFTLSNTSINSSLSGHEVFTAEVCLWNTGGAQTIRLYHGTTYPSSLSAKVKNINISQSFTYRGTGEVHVSSLYSKLSDNINGSASSVWNYPERNLTSFNFDNTNYTLINDYIINSSTLVVDTIQAVNNSISNSLYSINSSIYQSILDINNSIITQLSTEILNSQNFLYNYINVTYNSVVSLIGLIPQNVWNYPVRNLTYYEDVTNYTTIYNNQFNYTDRFNSIDLAIIDLNNSIAQVPYNVWNYVDRNLTYYPQQLDLTNYSLINDGVWSYNNRTLTEFVFDNTNYSYIIDSLNDSQAFNSLMSLIYAVNDSIIYRIDTVDSDVWTYIDRNLTYYPAQVDLTNYSQVAFSVWEYSNRNLTYYAINNITPEDVWTYINRTLTYYDVNNISTQDIWTYNNRTLTFYPLQTDLTNYTYLSESVWNYSNRNLTYYPEQVDLTNYTRIDESIFAINNSLSQNQLAYYNGIISALSIQTNIINDNFNNVSYNVWTYNTRNLTFYPEQLDLTNYSRIDESIFSINDSLSNNQQSYYNGLISALSVSTNLILNNISEIPLKVWLYDTRNLTYYPEQQDLTNYTFIIDSLNYTESFNGLYDLIVDVNNTLYGRISTVDSDVWTYVDRNLTYYPSQQDLTNYSLIAEQVWMYVNRNLTYYEVNNITSEDVWNYVNRTLTYYYENNITAQDVWTYNNRTLTYYPTQQDLTNYSYLTENVWNYTGRYTHGVVLN